MARPRSFDTQAALHEAVGVFLRLGYDGASLEDLTAAMGINKPSLYAAFGDKSALYAAALEAYGAAALAQMSQAVQSGDTLEAAAHALFTSAIDVYAPVKLEAYGCLIATTATTMAGADPDRRQWLQEFLARADRTLSAALEERFGEALARAELAPLVVARLLTGTLYSLAIRARAGASRRELVAIAKGTVQMLRAAMHQRSA